ncbi:hypothetical protein SEPCBS57363_000615 [Sporothrix epigloea]|uniref:Zn(2)-C6 fungal-type domain-containing protein n=1 Tax=Sporothrix epigloea TaxID=1892477 RepID=A0ABP0D5R7_9PEZI
MARTGAGSPPSTMGGTTEVRLLPSIQATHDEHEYRLNRASPKTTEPRTVPDLIITTRREREIWCTSPLERSPRLSPTSGYPDLENPIDGMQKRKRSPTSDEAPYCQDSQCVKSQRHQQHRHSESDLPHVLTASETAAAALAAASAAFASSHVTANKELEPPYTSDEPHDSDDLVRDIDRKTRLYANAEKEQQHVDRWVSQTTRNSNRQSGPPYDNTAYHQRSASMELPPEVNFSNDSCRQGEIAHACASPLSEYGLNSPDDDERPTIYSASLSPSSQRNGPPLQQTDPKRRKRNFSNRTKTGCLTCRKRKKKCDETKPECSNCVRGGFLCAGYPPQKGHWGQSDPAKAAVQIESKDPTYVAPGAYGASGPLNRHQGGISHQRRRDSVPLYRGQSLRIETPQSHLLPQADNRAAASTLPEGAVPSADSNLNKFSAPSAFSAPANVFPTPVSAAASTPFPDRNTPKEYRRVPPLHDLRHDLDSETPQLSTKLPQIKIYPSATSLYRQPSPQQSQQLPQLHDFPRNQQLWNEHQPHDCEGGHDYGSQQEAHGMQHTQQESHQDHRLPSPQQLHSHHQYPAHHPSQPMPERQSQPPLHRLPRQGPLHQETTSTDRQPRSLHQFFPHTNATPHFPQEQQQLQEPLIDAHDGLESKEAEEARAEARRNVPFFSTIPGTRSEMEEMLAGRPFYQFDNQLVDARERCVAACWKFNNSTNPSIGVSQSERSRLFKEILQPRSSDFYWPKGAVGDQVVVDAPFHADYGYNISIADAVHIGRNCHFSDVMPISIGQRVTIGPNVSFFTAAPSTDPMERDGVHSALQGRRIIVEDDAFIGGNVVVLAGVRIGKGAVIGAGSVVTCDLPDFTVSHGSPAVVRRGTSQA